MRDFEYEPKVIVKRKGGFLGKFVAFVLGIIFGIVGGLGGVAYAGYFVVTKVKIDDAMNTVNSLAKLEIDYTKYISGDYGQKTVYDLVGDAYKAAMNIATNSGTLQDLDDISPLVYDIIAGKEGEEGFSIVKFLQAYDVALDADKMMDLIVVKPAPTEGQEPTLDPDTYLMDYLMDCVQKMPASKLFDMLHISLNPMLDAIINGANGDDPLSLGQLMGADLMTRVYELPVAMFLENLDKNDTLMMTIAYGPAYRYTVNGSNVDMNQVFYTYNISEMKLYDGDGNNVTTNLKTVDTSAGKATIEINGETQYLKASLSELTAEVVKFYAYTDEAHATAIKYQETRVKDLNNLSDTLLNTLTLNDVLGETAVAGNDLLKNFGDTKIKDLPDELKTLKIGDLVDTSGNKILQVLANETFETLPSKLDTLKVQDVMDIPADNRLLNAVQGTELNQLADKIKDLTIGEMVDTSGGGILAALAGSKLSELNDNLNKVAIAENLITPDTTNKVVMYLLYGKEGVHYSVGTDGKTIMPLQKRVAVYNGVVYNEYGEEITGATASGNTYTLNGVTYTLTSISGAEALKLDQKKVAIYGTNVYEVNGTSTTLLSGAVAGTSSYTLNSVTYTLKQTADKITVSEGTANVYYVKDEYNIVAPWYFVSQNGTNVMYSPTTIADLKGTSEVLNNVMNRLTLSDVLSEEELANNKVLCHLSDVTISGLSKAIHDLTIEDVFEQDMYEKNADGSFKTDTSGNRIMKHTWEYMLLDPTTGNLHHEYTLEDNMEDLMTNFQKNVQHHKLEKLIKDGIIEFEDSAAETKFLKSYVLVGTEKMYLKNMNLEKLLITLSTYTRQDP